jgi:hypothetical protein
MVEPGGAGHSNCTAQQNVSMALIGEVIKKAIDFTGYISTEPNPVKAQKAVLKQLLKKAKLTAFGRRYKFGKILESSDIISAFQEHVPFHDYDKIYNDWWKYLLEGHQNITWPGGQK